MARRTVALYQDKGTGRTQYIGIESIFTVVDGKQINIPHKIDDLRKKSRNHELFCPCGCGYNLILVAGDKNLREQHFRIWDDGEEHRCHAVEEGDVSIDSKVVLKCWLDEKLRDPEVMTRVPIRSVDDSDRKYEFSFLSAQNGIALSYSYMRENLSDEKIRILENNKKNIRIYYIADSSNGGCDGQYPEWLMKIQRIQGYCLLLDIDGTNYAQARMKAVLYSRDLDGSWVEVKIAEGPLSEYWFGQGRNLLFGKRNLNEMKTKAEASFRTEQDRIRRMREEEERQKRAEQDRIRKIREEEEKRRRTEQERIRKQNLLEEEKRQRRQEAYERELEKRREEARAWRAEKEARKRKEEERLLEKKRQKEEEFKNHLAGLLDQQETQVRDPEGNRWIKCEYCGRAMPEAMFSDYGGTGRVNLGTCKECMENNPAARTVVRPPFRKRMKSAVRPRVEKGDSAARPVFTKHMESQGRDRCPDCGGTLLLKNGKYGPFWGCSNYPGCRYTRNC